MTFWLGPLTGLIVQVTPAEVSTLSWIMSTPETNGLLAAKRIWQHILALLLIRDFA